MDGDERGNEMNRQVRRLGIAIVLLFLLLFVNLNYLQVVRADSLSHDSRNGRLTLEQFSKPRGQIQTADGVVLARSVPSNDAYKLLRQYPEPQLFAQITGFDSLTFGLEGVEQTYNDELTAHRPTAVKDLRDALIGNERVDNVTLTLTKKLQQLAAVQLGNRKGAVVALDPKTGAVLAMYGYPSYDPNALAIHDAAAV